MLSDACEVDLSFKALDFHFLYIKYVMYVVIYAKILIAAVNEF